MTKRRTTAQRGYGNEHKRMRAALLPTMPGSPCTRCGVTLNEGDQVDLDHTDDRSGYNGWAHSSCNRRAGANKRNGRMLKQSRKW